jgi:hypothetical protein
MGLQQASGLGPWEKSCHLLNLCHLGGDILMGGFIGISFKSAPHNKSALQSTENSKQLFSEIKLSGLVPNSYFHVSEDAVSFLGI